MSGGKPKQRDDSTNKFLQRIAGKKALSPPPTPRPVIGEHPVRTLIRENSDDNKRSETENPVRAELQLNIAAATSPLQPNQNRDERQDDAGGIYPENRHLEGKKADTKGGDYQLTTLYSPPVEDRRNRIDRVDDQEGVQLPKIKQEVRGVKRKLDAALTGTSTSVTNAEDALNNIKQRYRLNKGEVALYKELYMMTHAVGKSECSFVVSELIKSTGMLERRVRDNIRRLKKNGWIVQLEGYDFENREKAKYKVNIEPEIGSVNSSV